MSSRVPADWMWAQAFELLDQAERMQRQFCRLAASGQARATWEPPVDVFEDEREIVVIVALPGVPAERIEVRTEAGALMVRAECALPLAGPHRGVRQLEIPYGCFERRIALPDDQLDSATRESTNGLLIVRLRKQAGSGRS